MKVGILREGKTPPDKRVPLTPQQCMEVQQTFSHVSVVVQPSPIRSYKDEEYSALGIPLQEDLSDCDVLLGVKEVRIEDFLPGKNLPVFLAHHKKASVQPEVVTNRFRKKYSAG